MIENINNLPEGFIPGLIAGSLATAFGFTLTLLWDVYKDYNTSKKKDKSVSLAIYHEVSSNIEILRKNKKLLTSELDTTKKKQNIVNPLSPLHNQMWSVVIINIPNKLIKNPNIFDQLRESVQEIVTITEEIKNRESWHVNNQAISGFYDTLETYDNMIIGHTNSLIEKLEILVQEFTSA